MVCPYSPMNRISSAVLLLLAAAVCSPARAESWGEGIAGFYVTVDGGAQVRVTRASDGSYTGTIVWLRSDKNRLDKNNPDPGRKGDRVLGLVILRELRANDETKRWEGGTIYDPKNGKTYDAVPGLRLRCPFNENILGLRFSNPVLVIGGERQASGYPSSGYGWTRPALRGGRADRKRG